MTFRADMAAATPYMEILDGGHRVFDTREGLFHGISFLSGSVVIPNRNSPAHATVNYSLGSVNSFATFVRGAFRIIDSAGARNDGVPAGPWFNAGGSYVHFYRGSQMSVYSFFVSGGVAYIEERVETDQYRNEVGQILQIVGFTIQYKLFIGGFT